MYNTIETIISKLSNQDLVNFLKKHLVANGQLRNDFLIAFAHLYKTVDFNKKYEDMIQDIIDLHTNNDGYIGYYESDEFEDDMQELLTKAERLVADGDSEEAFSMVSAVMESLPNIKQNDEYEEEAYFSNTWDAAEQVALKIANAASPSLNNTMYDYYNGLIQDFIYGSFDYSDEFFYLKMLSLLGNTDDKEKILFEFIDEGLRHHTQNNSTYGTERLLSLKMEYLNKRGRDKEAMDMVFANVHLSKFRMMLIESYIGEQKWEEAHELCAEGIAIDKQRYWKSNPYMEKLLEIAEARQDIEEIRDVAEKLFFAAGKNMDYYRLLKAHWPADDWRSKRELLINKIKADNTRGGLHTDVLANILVEDGLQERLLKLMETNAIQFSFIDRYAVHVAKHYPLELISMYKQGIREQAGQLGRPAYELVAESLNKLITIEGGKSAAADLVSQFRVVYKKRSAMMQILKRF